MACSRVTNYILIGVTRGRLLTSFFNIPCAILASPIPIESPPNYSPVNINKLRTLKRNTANVKAVPVHGRQAQMGVGYIALPGRFIP